MKYHQKLLQKSGNYFSSQIASQEISSISQVKKCPLFYFTSQVQGGFNQGKILYPGPIFGQKLGPSLPVFWSEAGPVANPYFAQKLGPQYPIFGQKLGPSQPEIQSDSRPAVALYFGRATEMLGPSLTLISVRSWSRHPYCSQAIKRLHLSL